MPSADSRDVVRSYVFISYAREDTRFVDRLVEDLRRNGIKIWRDVEQLAPGQNWQNRVRQALESAAALVFVASSNSNEASFVASELALGLKLEIPIVPVILDKAGQERLPTELHSYQWVDFRTSYDDSLGILANALKLFQTSDPIEPLARKSKGYVFISYAEADTDFVERLRAFLGTHGYGYWDYAESDRDYHNDLYLELEGVIADASATLSVLSPDWKRSRTAIKEFHFSVEVGTPVFLLKAQKLGPTLVIAGIPHIDFVSDESEGFRKLSRELKRKGL